MDRYKQIVELSGECIKEISLDGMVLDVNPNGLKLLRAPDASAVVGRRWADIWPLEAQPMVSDAMAAARRGERSEFESTCPDFEGESRDWRVRVCPLRTDGQISSLLAVSLDVTVRNRAVRAVELLTAALSQQQVDAQSQVDGLARNLESVESRLQATRLAYQQLELRHHEAEEGRRLAMAAQQAAELIAAQAQKGQAVGQLLAGVVHDLNNFLQSAGAALELVADSGELSSTSARYLAIAQKSLDQGTEMSRRLIGFAREHPYEPAPVDLDEMVTNLLPLLTQAVGSKVTISVELGKPGCCALVDRNTLERALMNLVINARDACEPGDQIRIETGRVTVTGEHEAGDAAAGQYLTLTVSDTGCGMSEDVMSKVFDVYFTTKRAGEGSGLGLPQVHSAVRQAGGYMTVHSAPGKGARFELALPQVPDA